MHQKEADEPRILDVVMMQPRTRTLDGHGRSRTTPPYRPVNKRGSTKIRRMMKFSEGTVRITVKILTNDTLAESWTTVKVKLSLEKGLERLES